MKKYALCLSGLPYEFARCAPSIIENIIIPNQCDVFIHAWHELSWEGKPYRPNTKFHGICAENTIHQLISTYQQYLKDIAIDPQIPFDVSHYQSNYQPTQESRFRTCSMFYSVGRANDLRKHYSRHTNIQYDGICRARLDLEVHTPIIFDNLSTDHVNVRMDCKHTDYCCNDHLAFGGEYVMNVYSNTFWHLNSMYNAGTPYCAEILLGKNLQNHGITLHDGKFEYHNCDEFNKEIR